MSKKAPNHYGDEFIIEETDDLNLSKVEKIKKDTEWMVEEETDLFVEVRNESYNYIQARGLLTNVILSVLNNPNINANVDAWKPVFEAYDTIINSDWLGEHEIRLLEEWFKPQLDRTITSIDDQEIVINPLGEYEKLHSEKEQKNIKIKKRK